MGESLEMGDEMGDPKDGGGKGQRALGAWGGEWEKPLGTRVVTGKGEGQGESNGNGGGGTSGGGGGKGRDSGVGGNGKDPWVLVKAMGESLVNSGGNGRKLGG